MNITLSEFDKKTFKEMSIVCIKEDCAWLTLSYVYHRCSEAVTIPLKLYDLLMEEYRQWLVFGQL